ncbi:SH3 domain-containing protein [uncultured Desulfobacter sp.]|uniref:SH3 domain-containing protein n=1 Tax=uncultured Desulfobacter sp. TaxID=240139 RepID=UPI0029F52987|nr:SH3 domain-containing protein [uncultured Desulfobacter sp.]
MNDFSNLETIEKNNEWSKVIIKGWIRSPLMPEDQTLKPKGFVPGIISLDEIQRHPESQNAPVVLWDVVFVKINKARMNTFAPDGTEYMWCWGPGGQTNNLTVLFNKKEDREIFRKIKKFEKSTLYLRLKSPNSGFSKGPVFEYVGRLKSKPAFPMEPLHSSDIENPMPLSTVEKKPLPDREGVFPMPMIVTAQSTLVRTGPGKDYRYLVGKKKGDIVVVTQQKGEWNKIQLSETTTGFIHSRLLKPFAPPSPVE